MEVIRLISSVATLVEGVRSMVKGDQDLQWKLVDALGNLKDDLGLLSSTVKETWALTKTNQVQEAEEGMAEPEEWILQLQDLAYQIEDFMDERGKDPITSVPVRIVKMAMLNDPRQEHVDTIENFGKRINRILECKNQCAAERATPQQVTPVPLEDQPVANPLGMEQSMVDLRGLLMASDGHQSQLKVISILGFGGMGKTTIVRALREDPAVVQRFSPWLAMVEVSSSSDRPVIIALKRITQQVRPPNTAANPASGYEQLKTDLAGILSDKRYLVIIDGVEEYEVFEKILKALPENKLGSRVVITTRNRSVATRCSSGSYIYTMNGLGGTYPADLFWATFNQQPPGEDGHDALASKSDWLQTLLTKTDGLPLVLVAAAEFLRQHGRMLTVEHCQEVGNALGYRIAKGGRGFGNMRRSLQQSCHNLSRHAQDMCMMSVSSFPKGHVIKKKSLFRRWIAEGLVANEPQVHVDKVAQDCLCTLLDLGIVEPVPRDDIATNIYVKRFQIQGVMLEFLVHRSLSWNFITLIKDGKLVPTTASTARRLSVHGHGKVDINDIAEQRINFSRIRSLTVCNDINGDPSNNDLTSWEECKLLRVLDLEGCAWLTDDKHLAAICELLHLKYLSLRNNQQVRDLPSAVRNLECLQTLDLRQTGVDKLPLEVLKLPHLAHLFGKFELPAELGDAGRQDEVERFLKRSKLHTLAGFKIVNKEGFTQILCHAKMLKNVKVWCEIPAASPQPSPPPPAAAAVAPPPPPPPPSVLSSSLKNITRTVCNAIKKKKKKNPNDAAVSLPNVAAVNQPNDVAVNLPNGGQVSLPKSLVDSLIKMRFTGSNILDSLSIDLGGHCRQFLGSVLTETCAVNCIKITGEMDMLPASAITTLTDLRNIYTLHLCNTGLVSEDLSVLQNIPCLNSLKLAENNEGYWQGDFVVTNNGFKNLQRLCFNGPKLPNVNFESGSMPHLLSLQLICLEPANQILGVTGIRDLKNLDEVILHPDASPTKIEAWKQEADSSINRPHVKRPLNGDGAQ